MSRTKNLYDNIENLVFEAIEYGANNISDIRSYVTQFVPSEMVTYDMVEDIAAEYSAVEYQADNVY